MGGGGGLFGAALDVLLGWHFGIAVVAFGWIRLGVTAGITAGVRLPRAHDVVFEIK